MNLFYQILKTFISKTKTILYVCALTASAFAWNATADENYEIRYDNQYEDYQSAAWLTQNNATSTLYTAVVGDAALNFAIEKDNSSNGFTFGIYTVDKDGNILQTQTLGTVDGTVDDAGKILIKTESGDYKNSVSLGNFNANDMVGVWVQETEKDIIYYSENQRTIDVAGKAETLPNIGGLPYQFSEGRLTDGLGPEADLWFDDNLKNPAILKYDDGYQGWDKAIIHIHIQGVAPGGPLPGVWATIALAGAASAYLRRRKNK